MADLINNKILVKGIVQGVGFRPFVFKLAHSFNLVGWVINNSDGVVIEVEGDSKVIEEFKNNISFSAPKLAQVDTIETLSIKSINKLEYDLFCIKESEQGLSNQTLISPDCVTCDDCLNELNNLQNRRFGYPFINCTNCGPRFSIIQNVPYDRPYTTMSDFKMCGQCESEYHDPMDRRFHAQPNACWDCGPQIQLITNSGKEIISDNLISLAVDLIKSGKIIALKGLGGYNLILDPHNEEAVARLRKLKKRPNKPLAIMGYDLDELKKLCSISQGESDALASVARPIVLCKKLNNSLLTDLIATKTNYYGLMLPNNPMQFLLLKDLKLIVCTSANISDNPMEYVDENAIKNLAPIADYILTNNRKINIRVDDSIVIYNQEEHKPGVIRRARGYVPLPIKSPFNIQTNGIALGAELKNTICINRSNEFFLSQHIGDLKNQATFDSHKKQVEHLSKILEVKPQYVACDMHPNFFNSREADSYGVPVYRIQHHHAHMASCMFDNGLANPVIGVIFDGVGYGPDGNLWGGEFLVGDYMDFRRFGHFSYFNLLGGDKAVKEPFRVALDLLIKAYGSEFKDLDLDIIKRRTDIELSVYQKMSESGLNSFKTSSVGRLFDGISALLQVREFVEYEAQAAIELENELYTANQTKNIILPYSINKKSDENCFEIDILPLVRSLAELMLKSKTSLTSLSYLFHDTIADIVLNMCIEARTQTGLNTVVLSGGVFQNQYLLNKCITLCKNSHFDIFTHSQVPTNDGGVSLGQGIIAAVRFNNSLNQI